MTSADTLSVSPEPLPESEVPEFTGEEIDQMFRQLLGDYGIGSSLFDTVTEHMTEEEICAFFPPRIATLLVIMSTLKGKRVVYAAHDAYLRSSARGERPNKQEVRL